MLPVTVCPAVVFWNRDTLEGLQLLIGFALVVKIAQERAISRDGIKMLWILVFATFDDKISWEEPLGEYPLRPSSSGSRKKSQAVEEQG